MNCKGSQGQLGQEQLAFRQAVFAALEGIETCRHQYFNTSIVPL